MKQSKNTMGGALAEIYKSYRKYADMEPDILAHYKADPGIGGYIDLLKVVVAAQKRGEKDTFDYEAAAMAVLKKAPKIMTPLKYTELTGFPWPDCAKVWYRTLHTSVGRKDKWWMPWILSLYESFKDTYCYPHSETSYSWMQIQVVCATEAGPPPDGWKPEERS